MSRSNINHAVEGEHAVSAEMIKIIPLIEKHFGHFDGSRCTLKSGNRSAPYQTVINNFYADCKEVTAPGTRVICDDGSMLSLWVKVDITIPTPGRDSVTYFKTGTHVAQMGTNWGDVPEGQFAYEFKPDACRDRHNRIRSISVEAIEIARERHRELVKKIEAVFDTIPYDFHDLIGNKVR